MTSLFHRGRSGDSNEFADLLAELTWTGKQYVGTQRAVERITGLAKSTIRQGLGCDPGRAADDSKMLKWLAAQGIKPGGIQKEWRDGAIKDAHIALLIRYAADESQTRPVEAQRWQRLIESVGFRQVIHELNGREDILGRQEARAKGLPAQVTWVDRLLQKGDNIGKNRAMLIQYLLGRQPKWLEQNLRGELPGVPASVNWRSHADKETLLLVQASESLAAVTGDPRDAALIRDAALRKGWAGAVKWCEDRVEPGSLRSMKKA